jgi:hypothetical protein
MRHVALALAVTSFAATGVAIPSAGAQAPAPPPASAATAATAAGDEVDADNDTAGYTPADPVGPSSSSTQALHLNGYVDVGFAKAGGNGTSFAPDDRRVPADYGVDAFAPAVNARGDVASTDAGDRLVNGFLPRSVGIGGRPSFLLNTVNLDARYQAVGAPVMIFTRVQLLTRLSPAGAGDASRLFVEQAFGRVTPFDAVELAVALGKFDSVFGIEYLDNQANIRTGVTPSLAARYTTGQSVGAKVFFRQQLAPLWSALSLNAAATNSGNMVESLQSGEVSLAGAPVLSARLGYELNLPRVQVKLGGSGLRGPRNDQRDRGALQKLWGGDLRVFVAGLALSGEYVRVDEDEGLGPKTTALGTFPLASGFHARVFWAQLAFTLSLDAGPLRRVTPYGRYEQRHAWFEGFQPITVDRITAGLRLDLWDNVLAKGEVLVNGEREGAPAVSNNVYTSSVVYQW